MPNAASSARRSPSTGSAGRSATRNPPSSAACSSEAALHHLERAERLTEAHREQLVDFDFAFLEALAARVHALAGNHDRAARHYEQAKEMGDALPDAEDRRVYVDQLAEEPWFGLKR